MGLSSFLHWSAWFTSSFIIVMLAYTIVTVFINFKIIAGTALFEYSNFFLIWIFFFFYNVSVVTFCFLISVIFKRATTAGNVGTIIFFLTHGVYYQFRNQFVELHYIVKILFCVPINSGLGQGISQILDLEKQTVGLQFSNFASHDNESSFSVAEVILAFLIGSRIHIMLTIYIEQVFTGDIGVAKPWYFPVGPIIKLFKDKENKEEIVSSNSSNANFEPDPKNMEAGIRIVNISKRFGKATAVNQLSLNMYQDQITVLLGHNVSIEVNVITKITLIVRSIRDAVKQRR